MGPHRQNCRPWSLCSWRRIFVAGTNLTCLHLIPRNCSDTTGLWRSPGAEWGERGVRGEGGIDLTIPRLTTMSWLHQTLSDIRVSNTRVQLLVTSSSHLLYIACFSFHNKILHQWSYFVVSLTKIFSFNVDNGQRRYGVHAQMVRTQWSSDGNLSSGEKIFILRNFVAHLFFNILFP